MEKTVRKGDGDFSLPPLKPGVDYINPGEEEQSEVYGYRRSTWRTAVTWVLIIATGGLLRLFFHWAPQYMLWATHTRCSLSRADRVLVVEHYKKYRHTFVKNVVTLSAKHISFYAEYSALRGGVTVNGHTGNHSRNEHSLENMTTLTTMCIPVCSGYVKEVSEVRMFVCKKLPYIWDEETESFYRLPGLDVGHTAANLHQYRGFSWIDQFRRRIVYGENAIRVPVKPVFKLLFLEALNPFYIFQLFSVCLWYSDDYIYYATVIVVTSVGSLISEVYQMHQNQLALSSTIQSSDRVEVVRSEEKTEVIPSEHLVPGDVIVIPPQGCMMQCDAVLLKGNAIVNESMLTGESVPVTKTPIGNRADVKYNEKEHGRHTLFCGTQVIQTRYYGGARVTAVVVRTGFLTSKGSLVRSIMYPPPVDFKFQQDSYKFIFLLVCIASVGFLYTVITKYYRGLSGSVIALDSLDLITIVVPPALPMAMTVGILFALRRLKKLNIFCISPRSINISGVLNCICFDKTGTLTEDGLDMRGAVGVENEGGKLMLGKIVPPRTLSHDHLLLSMTSCHSITIINMQMVGDPLDLKMFESTEWVLEEPGIDDTSKYDMIMPSVVRPLAADLVINNRSVETEPPLELGILRQFPFSSSLQRMSVITRRLGASHFDLYCKGSPEMIASLSKTETVPDNFSEGLLEFTRQGYRVLALAHRPLMINYLKTQHITREEVECELNFLGLLVLENRLKRETTPIIHQLRQASIRTVMVTGDNILTALSVGRECGIVDANEQVVTVNVVQPQDDRPASITIGSPSGSPCKPTVVDHGSISISMSEKNNFVFAIEGKSWSVVHNYFPDIMMKLLVRGVIFARMNPDQKQQLITELQSIGYYVGMCGDGANDCGALKAAHAGVSLSEAEASVASPFTSKEPNISCMPKLIREGRAALVTSFGVFKYMAAYSLTQFVSVMILYSVDSNLTDSQYLYIDLFLITVFAFFFGHTKAYKGNLSPRSPPASLMSIAPILSLLLHMTLMIGVQTFSFFHVQEQSWFKPFNVSTSEEIVAGYENYAVYSVSQFQYIILAVVFSRGPPYRQPLYTNYFLTGSFLIMTSCSIVLTIAPPEEIISIMSLVLPPSNDSEANFFRWQIILLAAFYCVLAVIVEYFIVDFVVYQKLRPLVLSNNRPKKYIEIENNFKNDVGWLAPYYRYIDGKPVSSVNEKEIALDPKEYLNNANNHSEVNGGPKHFSSTITQYQSSL